MVDSRRVVTEFNRVQLKLRPAAIRAVLDAVLNSDDAVGRLRKLATSVRHLYDTTERELSAVGEDTIEFVVRQLDVVAGSEDVVMGGTEGEVALQFLPPKIQTLNVYTQVPLFAYNQHSSTYRETAQDFPLFPDAARRDWMFRERYFALWHRTLSDPRFISPAEANARRAAAQNQEVFVVTPVDGLVGNPGGKLTFGRLSRIHEGCLSLEDPHRSVKVELPENGGALCELLAEGCFVLAYGVYHAEVFHIQDIRMPPLVRRELIPNMPNLFGGETVTGSQLALSDMEAKEEGEGDHSTYLVLSDVHLDDAAAFQKLTILLTRLERDQPVLPRAIVLMGNFSKNPFVYSEAGIQAYRASFTKLGNLLLNLPRLLKSTKILTIPGPQDPGKDIMPKRPLSNELTGGIADQVPNVTHCTNPLRLRHFSRELVFCRQDFVRKLRRSAVFPKASAGVDVPTAVTRVLLEQGHLCPFPPQEQTTVWTHDHALWLHPHPDALVLGDPSDRFSAEFEGVPVCNVGSFSAARSLGSVTQVEPFVKQLVTVGSKEEMDALLAALGDQYRLHKQVELDGVKFEAGCELLREGALVAGGRPDPGNLPLPAVLVMRTAAQFQENVVSETVTVTLTDKQEREQLHRVLRDDLTTDEELILSGIGIPVEAQLQSVSNRDAVLALPDGAEITFVTWTPDVGERILDAAARAAEPPQTKRPRARAPAHAPALVEAW